MAWQRWWALTLWDHAWGALTATSRFAVKLASSSTYMISQIYTPPPLLVYQVWSGCVRSHWRVPRWPWWMLSGCVVTPCKCYVTMFCGVGVGECCAVPCHSLSSALPHGHLPTMVSQHLRAVVSQRMCCDTSACRLWCFTRCFCAQKPG